MRTMKRLLTCLLSVALVVSAFVMPVFAESTIDPNATGSITINKYEGNDTKTPLAGVEFTIYQIATIEQVNQNGSVEVVLTPVNALSGLNITGSTTYAEIKAALGEGTLTPRATGTTAANGQVKFENLPVGVYMVEETKAPAQIVERSANFLVSIPMVNATGDGWNYNVVANPKNTPVRGGISLKKYGKVGADAEVALQGATFTLEQETAEDVWTTVTTDSKGVAIPALVTDATGMLSVSDLAPGTYRFRETAVPANSGYILDDVSTFEFTIDTKGEISIVGEKVEIAPATDTTDAVYAIKVVNEKPDFKKEINTKDLGEDRVWGDANDKTEADETFAAGAPTVAEYRLSVEVPTNVDKLTTFTVTDTMENLTLNTDSVKIYTDADLQNEILAGQYTVAWDAKDKTFSIPFNTITKDASGNVASISTILTDAVVGEDRTIYIYFTADLDESAVVKTDNINEAELIYSNELSVSGDPLPKENKIIDEVTVYTFEIGIEKVDANNTATKLAGAEFDLYRYNGTQTSPNEAELKANGVKINANSLVSDSNGKIQVEGLENGTYYLVETKAPTYMDGEEEKSYNLLKEPFKVEIAITYSVTTTTTTTTDANGVTTTKTEITETSFEGNGADNGMISVVVKNKTGFELPTTGGIGTIAFTVIGATLIIGGALLLRNKKEEDVA